MGQLKRLDGRMQCIHWYRAPMFMVRDDVWAAAGFHESDLYCFECLEHALGRPVTVGDFEPDVPLNHESWWPVPGVLVMGAKYPHLLDLPVRDLKAKRITVSWDGTVSNTNT